jgi:hypothetical protein
MGRETGFFQARDQSCGKCPNCGLPRGCRRAPILKLDALDHPKTLDFAARLNVSRPTAIGHLELFWHFAAKHAPRGNIGKFPDGAIARACDWTGDPESLVKALLKSGLIDESETHRYLVHDWPEHCPNWVRAQLQKLKTPFFSESASTEERTEEPSTRARVSKGSQGKGREAIPREGSGGAQPVDSVDNSAGGSVTPETGEERRFSGQNAPPEEPPSRRGAAAERRNGDFDEILEAVSKLLNAGACKAGEYATIARLAHVSTLQAEIAVKQLRDRNRLPLAGVA